MKEIVLVEAYMKLFQEKLDDHPSFGTIILRRKNGAYCPLCENLVTLTTIAESAVFFCSDRVEVEQLAESGLLHRIHNRKGEIMICSGSLFRCFEDRQTQPLSVELLPRLNVLV